MSADLPLPVSGLLKNTEKSMIHMTMNWHT